MKKVLTLLALVIVGAVGLIFWFSYQDTQNPYVRPCDFSVPEAEIPTFDEVSLAFDHRFDADEEFPITAGAVIDIDGDGIEEVFFGGGAGQADALFRFENGAFRDISRDAGLGTVAKKGTLGAISFDLDEDGWVDLLLTRPDGVFFLKNTGGSFESRRLEIEPDEKSTPGTLTVGDFDRDGDADLFLATYIKKEFMEGQTIFNQHDYGSTSLLLRNEGGLRFDDVTEAMGLRYVHNTFQGVFVDVDKDGWLDLVVAYDTGEARTYKNYGGERFAAEPNPLTGRFAYPMGVAVGDFNNDLRTDFFFSNTGTTIPRFLAKGDLREDQTLVTDWLLFRNDGEFRFTDVAPETQVADFEFSWGALFEDFNLDGRQDLVVAENYIAFPSHKLFRLPCRFLLQRSAGTFAAVEKQAGVENRNFAIAPITADFNDDGYPDLVYVNLGGRPKAFLSRGGSDHSIRVRFPEQARFVGARAELTTLTGETLSDVYVVGEGLASDSSATLTFGLGAAESAATLELIYPDGTVEALENPAAGTVYPAGNLEPPGLEEGSSELGL